MLVITLATKEWEHDTTISYPFTDINEGGGLASSDLPELREYRCGGCGKAFRISFIAGAPCYWDEAAEHEQPTSLEIVWQEF